MTYKTKRKLAKLRRRYRVWLCRNGSHRWGKFYSTAGKTWAFGMGHHARNCQRRGCDYVLRYSPADDLERFPDDMFDYDQVQK